MKPNYNEMKQTELRAYILDHRNDLDTEQEWQKQLEIIRPLLK